jgi:TatD DNase family protein
VSPRPTRLQDDQRVMIDTHAHLDACEEPAAFLVERARALGVSRIITVGTGLESCRAALAIAQEVQGVWAALGIDPHRAAGPDAARVGELANMLAHPRAVAVGETGLDYFHDLAPRHVQRALFDRQLELATSLGLPVVIHTRDADADTAAALEGVPGTVVLHCFSAPGLLETAVERRYYVSFAGNVTYPKAAELRAAAALVPADRILAETDSPYLAPQPLRGRRNEPANIVHTLAVLAEARGMTAEELERQIDRNASAAFGLPAS